MRLGRRRTSTLDGNCEHHLAHRGALGRPRQPTSLIDQSHQVQLLGNPNQGARVADALSADGVGERQVGHGWGIGWTQHGLPCKGTLLDRVPYRLRSDAVAPSANYAFEYIHSFI